MQEGRGQYENIMADKTPVRVVFNASNVATGMAEFQTGETVPVANGGTGLSSIGSAGQILKVNAAGNALEFGAEGDLSITNLVAPTNADLTLSTSGTGNIVLDQITLRGTTFSSTDSSSININEGLIVDGTLNVSGSTVLSGLTYPTSDGSVNQVLATNGSGTLSFISAASTGSLTFSGNTISGPSNADISIQPGGTGDVLLSALRVNGTTLDSSDSSKITIAEAVDVTGAFVAATSINIAGDGATVTGIKDEDNMASDSATALATQQSIKAYVDGEVAGLSQTSILQGNSNVTVADSGTGNVTIEVDGTDRITTVAATTTTATGHSLVIGAGSNSTGGSIKFLEGTDNGTNGVTLLGPASTTDVTVTLPAATDTLVGKATTDTFTNKTFDLGGTGNSLTGSLAEFNSALQGDSFVSLTGSETITNKTLTSPTINAATMTGTITVDGLSFADNTISTNESNSPLELKANGTGAVIITSGGVAFTLPTADGTSGQALVTDGAGNLSFDSVSTTVSDDTLATVRNNKSLGSAARTIDSINATFIDSAFYFLVQNDIVNEVVSAELFAVTNNDSASFLGNRRGIESSGGSNVPTLTTDVSNGQLRVRATGSSSECKASFYKVAMSSSTADATRGNTVTSSNTDVDSASESIDTFAHATFRGAKYFISVDNDSKTEMDVVEALVVHDGSDAFIKSYGHTRSGSNPLITLTAAISGDNVVVSAAGLEPNLNLTIHKILLKDNMTAESNANQKAFAAVTISSTATAIDLMDIDDANGAVYFIVGANSSEGAFSIQEVYTAATPGIPAVANGPFVSTKASTQIEFTAEFDTSSENSLELFASSTSGGSTTVSGYRISALAG